MFIEFAWLIPLIPLIGFVIVGLFGKKTPEGGGYIAIATAVFAFVMAALVSYDYLANLSGSWSANNAPFISEMQWLVLPGTDIVLNFGIYIDSLTCVMMLFASFISLLILIYSVGYMHDQGEKKRRYYAEVGLFLTGMLGLVLASNYLELFVFWEIMGICSYLLIGFWSFKHPEGDEASDKAASAAKKAFLVTRLGDVSLMAGLIILMYSIGSLDFAAVFSGVNLADQTLMLVAGLLIFGGVIGKSAQFPLQDWLPDAMAGPTTVSALIHAATMVKAGVYLTARSFPILVQNPEVLIVVAVIGGVTAFIAASMAMVNMNLKRVLAYSTISQLGMMLLALGAGGYLIAVELATDPGHIAESATGYTAGVFHMMNHAFFKALLFLCAGSVIHAVATEDMRQMGGLSKKMKITSITMLIGSLSIAGFPLLSGFWSKDMIFEAVLEPFNAGMAAGGIFLALYILALITAFMTAFYMFRMWYMTFKGKGGPAAEHCHGESPKTMTIPLVILSIFAVFSGYLIFFGLNGLATFNVELHGADILYIVGGFGHSAMSIIKAIFLNPLSYVAMALALSGICLAYLMYGRQAVNPSKFNKSGESRIYKFLSARYFFPQLYNKIAWVLGYDVAKIVEYSDKNIVDGTVNEIANGVVGGSGAMAAIQTGNVRNYTGIVAAGVIALVVVLFILMNGGL